MRLHNYYLQKTTDNYGYSRMPDLREYPDGQIKMAIYTANQSVQDNVNYRNANYVGLTQAEVNDTYIIEYENELLKVLYVNPHGRYKQVFMVNT